MRSQPMMPSTVSRVQVVIDQYDSNRMEGRLIIPYLNQQSHFRDILQLINQMESFFEAMSFPQCTVEYRAGKPQIHNTNPDATTFSEISALEASEVQEKICSFFVHVTSRQHACWQGSFEPKDEKAHPFNSVLELMRLIDNHCIRAVMLG